jgi:hypothetical protein
MPILRHAHLEGGGPIELTMAWVALPALSVQVDHQRYRPLTSASDHSVVRYEPVDRSFAAAIVLDTAGVIIDYPGIGRRPAETTLPSCQPWGSSGSPGFMAESRRATLELVSFPDSIVWGRAAIEENVG